MKPTSKRSPSNDHSPPRSAEGRVGTPGLYSPPRSAGRAGAGRGGGSGKKQGRLGGGRGFTGGGGRGPKGLVPGGPPCAGGSGACGGPGRGPPPLPSPPGGGASRGAPRRAGRGVEARPPG